MSNTLSKCLSNYFVKFLLLVLILSFALWGMSDFLKFDSGNYAIKIGNYEISKHEWDEMLRGKVQEVEQRFRKKLTNEELNSLGIKQQLATYMENNALLLLEARRLGILIGDETVKQEILKVPTFQKDGKFDPKLLEQVLKSIGLTEKDFITKIKEDLSRRYLVGAFTSNRLVIPDVVQQFINAFYETRKVKIIKVSKNAVQINKKPNRKDLMKFYEKNKNDFVTPEQRKVSYLVVGLDNIPNKTKIDDGKLKKLYEQKIFLFKEPEKREVNQIIFKSAQDANNAREELESGGTFEQVAKKFNGDLTHMKLGTVLEEELGDNISSIIFNLQKDKISIPVETPMGWHLFKVLKITPSSTKSFEEVKTFLKEQAELENKYAELGKLVKKVENELKSKSADSDNLEEVAKLNNLIVKKVDLDQNNLTKFLDDSKNSLVNTPEFFRQAFDIKSVHALSPMFPINDSNFCVIRVDKINDSVALDYDAAKKDVLKLWKDQQYTKNMEKFIKNIKAQIDSGKKDLILSLNNDMNIGIKELFVKRDGYNEEIPVELMEEIFNINVHGTTRPIKDNEGNYLIAYVESKSSPEDQDTFKYMANIQMELINIEQDALLAEYLNTLRNKYKIIVNKSIFN